MPKSLGVIGARQMGGDIYASVKELTHPKSAGRPINKHAVSANQKLEPDFERMRKLSHPDRAQNLIPA